MDELGIIEILLRWIDVGLDDLPFSFQKIVCQSQTNPATTCDSNAYESADVLKCDHAHGAA